MYRILQIMFLLLMITEAKAEDFFYQEARAKLITGKVIDENKLPLIGVSVKIKGGTGGAITNAEGDFTLSVKSEKDSIQFSYIGYKTQTISAGVTGFVTIQMTPRSKENLDEVAIVGYGTQKKVSVTGAISTISVSEMQKVSTPSLSNAIAGKLPGIITRQATGEPGYDAAAIYIRGLSTFGQNAPLVLIDGVERDMNQINAQEIESFTILKDASATAVYGVRGANGVILLTTKRGSVGKPAVTFRSEAAALHAMRLPEYINAGQYASLMNEARINSGNSPTWSDEEIRKFKDGSDPYLYPNSNWTDAVLKKDTWQTIQNLSVTGGSDVIKYYTNVGFTLQDGIYKQDNNNPYNTNANIKRYNFRSNVDINLSKSLYMQLGIGGIIHKGNYPGWSAPDIFNALKVISPIAYPVTNPDGTPGGAATYLGWNPWARATQSGYTTQDRLNLQGTFAMKWDLSSFTTKGLSLRALFAYDRYTQTDNPRRKAFLVKRYLGKDPISGKDLYSTPFQEEQPLGYGVGGYSNRAIYTEAQINYERSFGKHSVTSMLLLNERDYVDLSAGTSVANLPYRRRGLSGRTTYNYDNRYLVEFNFGYNGSENFPDGKKYGFFPAASAGWVVSNEKFWKVNFVSNLKIRASRGLVGNDNISQRFLFLSTIRTNGQSYLFGADQQLFNGMEEEAIGNPNVTWERATKNNIGIDLGLFKDRITLQIDAFNEDRKDILLRRGTVPDFAGFFPWSIPYGNLGRIKNKGIDGLLEIKNTTSKGLFYSLRTNFTWARNTIVENDEPSRKYAYLSGKGLPLLQPLGFVADGFFSSLDEIETSPRQTFSRPRVGDVKYKDIDGDGLIDANDRIPIGYARLPQMTFGFGGTVAYKGFDASVYFTGAAQTSLMLSGTSMWPFFDGAGVNNVLTEYYDNRWTPENRNNALYPAIDEGNNPNNFVNSTLYMRNGDYLRLRNAEIGYSLPKRFNNKIGVSNMRLFINAVNLYTWDHIKIIDPESNDGTGGYPLQRSFNAGLQIDFK
ncbi:SusC/RagA family TonB-linked outer membrane protein [Pedobacter heparinus]|nr:TonB-dependent receptor [Pedobacter heparinus]